MFFTSARVPRPSEVRAIEPPLLSDRAGDARRVATGETRAVEVCGDGAAGKRGGLGNEHFVRHEKCPGAVEDVGLDASGGGEGRVVVVGYPARLAEPSLHF